MPVFLSGLRPVSCILYASIELLFFECLFSYEDKETSAQRIKNLLYEG